MRELPTGIQGTRRTVKHSVSREVVTSTGSSQVPLGIELDKIVDPWGQKMQLFVNPQYNFAQDESNSGWTLYLGLTLLVPEA